ncbi:MAG: di-heme oxidoredictase family protein [Pirellulales bacterium]
MFDEWRTPPLWGVASSAPYMHDGRAATLHQAIVLHGGQGKFSRDAYSGLPAEDRGYLISFLKTLVAARAEPNYYYRYRNSR